MRVFRVFEAASLLLFFGSLSHDASLQAGAERAAAELAARGFAVSAPNESVRVYAAAPGALDPHQAGRWQPGVISVRENPQSDFPREVYLRHELMHQAIFRTCDGRMPLWAQEGAAMHFSGEASPETAAEPTGAEIGALRRAVYSDARLTAPAYQALRKLVSIHSWPEKPCAVSDEIADIVAAGKAIDGAAPAIVVMSVLSGRILLEEGATKDALPLGSLLKIPYAASLSEAENVAVGTELARSDTAALLARSSKVRPGVLERLLSPLKNTTEVVDGARWTQLLGERDESGAYPIVGTLAEAALVMRNSLLEEPSRFMALSQNGTLSGSTLEGAPESMKNFFRQFRVIAKTGTAANAQDRPLVGNLLLAWPAESPVFLAVARAGKMKGASVAAALEPVLPKLRSQFPPQRGKVRFRVLTRLTRSEIDWFTPCRMIEQAGGPSEIRRISECGLFEIRTKSIGARSRRWFRGVLVQDGDILMIETDPETYADQVLEAEAADSKGELRKALRAVVIWNGLQGNHRHREWGALCDTTHCMVNRGFLDRPDTLRSSAERVEPALLEQLALLGKNREGSWLQFSKGGLEQWEAMLGREEVAERAGEENVLEIQRDRKHGGDVVVQLTYPSRAETISCENFRNRYNLPSCPEEVVPKGDAWIFRGKGEGHGQGLDITRATALAKSGKSAKDILTGAYPPEGNEKLAEIQ